MKFLLLLVLLCTVATLSDQAAPRKTWIKCQTFSAGFCQRPDIDCPPNWTSKFWDYGCVNRRSKCCTQDKPDEDLPKGGNSS